MTDIEKQFYRSLTEKEKIPFRIEMAEILAMEELREGTDLKPVLEDLVLNENYCGAEGIRRALDKFKKLES